MKEKDIEQSIMRYLDDGFGEIAYIAKIVNSLPFIDLDDLICRLLVCSDKNTVDLTQIFLRDAILYGSGDKSCDEFVKKYPDSAIVKQLEELVFSDYYSIRTGAIYTLGKTGSYSSKNTFIRAFDRFQDTDPLMLSGLIHVMCWLGVDNMELYLERMAHSSSYLTRWAATEHIHGTENMFPDWVEVLRNDDRYLVRAEAEYHYQKVLKSIQTATLSKLEQRQRAREIKNIEPKISFQSISMVFCNDRFVQNGLTNYSVAELSRYIEDLKL